MDREIAAAFHVSKHCNQWEYSDSPVIFPGMMSENRTQGHIILSHLKNRSFSQSKHGPITIETTVMFNYYKSCLISLFAFNNFQDLAQSLKFSLSFYLMETKVT